MIWECYTRTWGHKVSSIQELSLWCFCLLSILVENEVNLEAVQTTETGLGQVAICRTYLEFTLKKYKYMWFSKYIMSLGSMCIFTNLWVYLSFSLRSLLGCTRSCSQLYSIEFFTIFRPLKLLPFLRLLEDICGCFSLPWPIFLILFFFFFSVFILLHYLVTISIFPLPWCESWTVKKAERRRVDAFELWCWRRLLRVPWTARRSYQFILKDISPGISLEGMTKAETPVLWPPHVTSWLIGKDSDAGRDGGQEEKGTTEDEMAGWHHWLDGRESGWTPGVGDGQGGLACFDSWGQKESDRTERLIWSDLILVPASTLK